MNKRIEELRAASDAEVNLIAAKLNGDFRPAPDGFHAGLIGDVLCYQDNLRSVHQCHSNYCDDWECAGALMVDNGIDLKNLPSAKSYAAVDCGDFGVYSLNENPLRAIAETYIIMKWSEE